MGKEKKEKRKSEALDESQDNTKDTYEDKLRYLNPISQPLASRKQMKKICKVIKKANSSKAICLGIRDVQKAIRKGQKGVVVIAGDVTPIDIYSHIPVVCEDANLPYCFVPSKTDISTALGQGNTIIALVKKHDDYAELYDEVYTTMNDMPLPL